MPDIVRGTILAAVTIVVATTGWLMYLTADGSPALAGLGVLGIGLTIPLAVSAIIRLAKHADGGPR